MCLSLALVSSLAIFSTVAVADMQVTLPAKEVDRQAATRPYREAPGWQLQTVSGETVLFPRDAKGQPSVLLFWPSWCPFSRALQPYVQSIWEDYRERGVNVWTINILENADPVQTMKDRKLSFPLLLDGDSLIPGYGIERTPWLVVIDGQNRIVYTRPPDAPTPIHVAKAVRTTLNRLVGDRAVPMPAQFPPPYDLHLRSRDERHFSPVPEKSPENRDDAADWNSWAHDYLAGFTAGRAPEASSPIIFGDRAPGLLEQSRQRWRAEYGEAVVARYRQFKAYRLRNLWLTASLSQNSPPGSGLLLVFEADSGRILHMTDGE